LIRVELVTVKLDAAVVPNLTDVAPVRFVPFTVTVVPPLVDPVVGENEVTVGAWRWGVAVRTAWCTSLVRTPVTPEATAGPGARPRLLAPTSGSGLTALVRWTTRGLSPVADRPVRVTSLRASAVLTAGRSATVKVWLSDVTTPVSTTASVAVGTTPVTAHDVVAVQVIRVSVRPTGTVSDTHDVAAADAGPAMMPSPCPSVPMAKHAVTAQVSWETVFIVIGSASCTHDCAVVVTEVARTSGTEGVDVVMPPTRQAVVAAQAMPVIDFMERGSDSLVHASGDVVTAPTRTTGPDDAVPTMKHANLDAHFICEMASMFEPDGRVRESCTQLSGAPVPAPARTTGPDGDVPTTKHPVVPAQVIPVAEVSVTPEGRASFDQVSENPPVTALEATAPRMTAPVAVVPMARQPVELGHRT